MSVFVIMVFGLKLRNVEKEENIARVHSAVKVLRI
jgi:hypothetical protein